MSQEIKRPIKLVSIEEIKPIKLFDILIDDGPHTLDSMIFLFKTT